MLYSENTVLGKMSAIGLGCWNFGAQWGNKVSEADAIEIIRHAIDNGVNVVDVAESYGYPDGQCEMILGKALKDGYRDKVLLISKIGWWGRREQDIYTHKDNFFDRSAKRILKYVNNKLYHTKEVDLMKRTPELLRLCGHACCGRLQTDHIDVLLCHDGNPKDAEAFVKAFRCLKEEGFIRHYGISTNSISALRRFYEISGGECAVCEFEYSLLNRSAEKELISFCESHEIAMICRGVLCRGLLSGKYSLDTEFTEQSRIQWNKGGVAREWYENAVPKIEKFKSIAGDAPSRTALSFAVSHPAHPSVIVGCTSLDQIKQNIAACQSYMPEQKYKELLEL